jgi:hypothetical protein
MQLKIYSDLNYLPQEIECEAILVPFFGSSSGNAETPMSGSFDAYVNLAHSIFNLSSIEETDLVVLPGNWEPYLDKGQEAIAVEFIEMSRQARKPSISFFGGDCSHIKLPAETDLIFRHSLYRSLQSVNSFSYPATSEDFIKKYLNDQLSIRTKRAKPTVGFCGFAEKQNFKTYAKYFLYQGYRFFWKERARIPPYSIGHVLRQQALARLAKSSLIETNFIQRKRSVFFNQLDSNSQKKLRMEYVQNMINSDYIFCCRGSGNYSFRFYETLCCGRIPVFLDTDCVLPFDFEIDWKNYCVWVNESELSMIAEKVAEFHASLAPKEFIDLQYECRKIWKERIAPEGFFSNLHRHFSQVTPDPGHNSVSNSIIKYNENLSK